MFSGTNNIAAIMAVLYVSYIYPELIETMYDASKLLRFWEIFILEYATQGSADPNFHLTRAIFYDKISLIKATCFIGRSSNINRYWVTKYCFSKAGQYLIFWVGHGGRNK